MYSGTTFRRNSGKIAGVHQKIDRASRRYLDQHIKKSINFPGIRSILHFEGKNGPDGIKLKSPNKDELIHFIDPTDPNDKRLIDIISSHLVNLSVALKAKDDIRASFEAAWLAHAVVDGLTPPHHYPPTAKVRKYLKRVDKDLLLNNRKNMPIEVKRNRALIKKWSYWGTKGVMTHVMFEWGVASAIAASKFKVGGPTESDIKRLEKVGFIEMYMESVQKIHALRMYEEYNRTGWTRSLAHEAQTVLIPEIMKAVTLAWYQAIIKTGK